MNLLKIMNKLKNFDYDTAAQVWDDFKLIFDNCRTYNVENSEFHEVSITSSVDNSKYFCFSLLINYNPSLQKSSENYLE